MGRLQALSLLLILGLVGSCSLFDKKPKGFNCPPGSTYQTTKEEMQVGDKKEPVTRHFCIQRMPDGRELRQGRYVAVLKTGKIYVDGNYRDDIVDGTVIVYNLDGSRFVTSYIKGQRKLSAHYDASGRKIGEW